MPPTVLPALVGLLEDLSAARIRFCSWKSNEHLGVGLAGKTDVDLLVDERQIGEFRIVLARHGVKPLTAAPARTYPGMEHHLGLDRSSGRLFHLHVHTQLVLGEEHVKNHHVAMEERFLDSARPLGEVPVPAPELELAILAVRVLLKYRARDVVKDMLKIRTPGIKPPVRAELSWLFERTSAAEVRTALEGAPLPAETVCRFLETYRRDPRAGATFLRLRSRLRRELAGARRGGGLRAKAHALGANRRANGHPLRTRMRPSTGGLTIALVGSDGSGKSTVAAELTRWFGWKLAVRRIYLGSKSPSRTARASYGAFRACRRGHRAAARRLGEDSRVSRAAARTRDVVLALHDLAIGRDRARRCREGRRDADGGCVVVFDRFPLDALSSSPAHRILDGPRIARTLPRGRLLDRLARREERLYAGLGLPDVLVFMRIDADEAFRRKPDHTLEVLASKTRAADELASLGARTIHPVRVLEIDATAPLDDVVRTLKSELWDVL